jgi:hypothetical protein
LNKDAIRKWPLKEQLVGLDIIVFHRMLDELVLVGALSKCRKDKSPIPKEETLADLVHTIDSERGFIQIVGRKAAAKVYGKMEGVTSAMKTVDFVTTFDFEGYYSKLIADDQKA